MTYQDSQKNVVMQKFSNITDVTTPVITPTQFKQQYGNGYKVFTRQGIKSAIDALSNQLSKGIGSNDNIKSLTEEINSCQRVYVSNGQITDVFLVKAYTKDEIEKAQKDELNNIESYDENHPLHKKMVSSINRSLKSGSHWNYNKDEDGKYDKKLDDHITKWANHYDEHGKDSNSPIKWRKNGTNDVMGATFTSKGKKYRESKDNLEKAQKDDLNKGGVGSGQHKDYQKHYDNYMKKNAHKYEEGGEHYDEEDEGDYGDRQHDDAHEYAESKIKNVSKKFIQKGEDSAKFKKKKGDPELEEEEEREGRDLDDDDEEGESEEHKEKVIGKKPMKKAVGADPDTEKKNAWLNKGEESDINNDSHAEVAHGLSSGMFENEKDALKYHSKEHIAGGKALLKQGWKAGKSFDWKDEDASDNYKHKISKTHHVREVNMGDDASHHLIMKKAK